MPLNRMFIKNNFEKGFKFFDIPLENLTREELKATVVFLTKRVRALEAGRGDAMHRNAMVGNQLPPMS